MNTTLRRVGAAVTWLGLSCFFAHSDNQLTFADRVRHQTAVDMLYFAQPTSTAAEVDSIRVAAEERVRRFVVLAAQLERTRPGLITAASLRVELDRMTRETRSPRRLRALLSALQNDRFVVEECLVRPALTDRIARERPSSALPENGAGSSETDDASMIDLMAKAHLVDLPAVSRATGAAPLVGESSAEPDSCLPEDSWNNVSLDDFPEPVTGHSAVWTGSLMLIWGGNIIENPRHGWRYDPALNTWSPIQSAGSRDDGRVGHTAVWTGSKMIVWGGQVPNALSPINTGSMYDPVTNTWSITASAGAPSVRTRHTAVWTGTEMLIWGGYGSSGPINTGARYNPATNTWRAMSTSGAPSARRGHVAQWSGSQMLVWGGQDAASATPSTGGRYSPTTNTWTSLNSAAAPEGRTGATSVWTGTSMVVWGGQQGAASGGGFPIAGGRYNPTSDTWSSMATNSAPPGRIEHSAVWTGTQMLIYGGHITDNVLVDETVHSYDPTADSWQTMAPSGSPTKRYQHSAIWSGTEMVVWGGTGQPSSSDGDDAAISGGRFRIGDSTWLPMSQSGAPWAPSLNLYVRGVWVGGRVHYPASGRAYDPALDTWVKTQHPPVSDFELYQFTKGVVVAGDNTLLLKAVEACSYDAVRDRWSKRAKLGGPQGQFPVWTGTELFVYGGITYQSNLFLADAGLYSPSSDRWRIASTVGQPFRRDAPLIVWTGTEVIVFGGQNSTDPLPAGGAGARYNPVSDTWAVMSAAPYGQVYANSCSAWTGTELLIWRVDGDSAAGLRYSPATDTWSLMGTAGAPSPRGNEICVWTGKELIVWGGNSANAEFDTGARYSPATDTWSPMSSLGAPSPRSDGRAVWTGSEMIVQGGSNKLSGGRYALRNNTDDDGDGLSECNGDCDDSNASIHPGAAETCNRRDDDCDGLTDELPVFDVDGDLVPECTDNCPLVPNPTQADSDGDREGDACDCAPSDPGAFKVPPEIVGLRVKKSAFIGDLDRLVWQRPFPTVGVNIQYDSAQGKVGQWPAGTGPDKECLGRTDGWNDWIDFGSAPPAPGEAHWYLVRGVNSCGLGPWGSGSDGTPRDISVCP